jgi:hypothetical protein
MKSISLESINVTLTSGGRLPLKCSFAVGELIYVWGPKTSLGVLKMEDNDIYQACKDYLYQQGQGFNSLSEAIAVAVRDKWPNWERLPRPRENDDSDE